MHGKLGDATDERGYLELNDPNLESGLTLLACAVWVLRHEARRAPCSPTSISGFMALGCQGWQEPHTAPVNTGIPRYAGRTDAGRAKAEKNHLCQAPHTLSREQTAGSGSDLCSVLHPRS